ncbi:MAG: TlpA family protein disulfide reductase [Cytophagaceae bacterium]|nr:TlpA family protein disulfide reductase [Cytophagaceae bacterium]
MKQLLVILGVCLTFLGQAQEFELTVRANQVVPQKKVFLEWINGRGQAIKVDSLLPNAQKQVVFKGKVLDQGGFYLLNFFDIPNPQKVLVILEGGERVFVQAEGINTPEKAGSFQIQSDAPNIVYMNQLFALTNTLQAKVAVWTKELQDKPGEQARIQAAFETAQQEQFAKIKALIPSMGTHLVALWATNFLPAEKELALLEEIGERFRKVKPNHPQVKPFLENLKRLKGVSIGSEAPEIALPTPAGPIMRLSDLRGKYVLIDFWASWCGPCRRENPNVIKTYAAYKDKGFEIFGVSLDQEKSAWINAIAKDQLTWPHVSDLQYWNSVAAQAYQVSSIPMTFLLDPQGKVIAKGLRGDSLNQYLANLFSK